MTDLAPPPELVAAARGVNSDGAARNRVRLEASAEFVQTPAVRNLTERALTYLGAGYGVHLAGPSGTGKTTLAFHIAAQLGRQVVLIHGDDELGSADLVGRGTGYRRSRVVDNFIHSVVKTEEEMTTTWIDNRLTTACQHGLTLIYDEFNRSRPEANNALLPVLSEGILNLPNRMTGAGYLTVHPGFRAIFTSNPEEYVGVHKTQNALMGRLITIQVGHYDRETEVEIVWARSEIERADAERIVDLTRRLRDTSDNGHHPSIRAAIALARALAYRGGEATPDNPGYVWACRDILGVEPEQEAQAVRHAGRRTKARR
ncbi:gas vesicle protein GvpN [Burkholderia oklahomensis]|uniref:gas vesicle protein GvpN n=1 Tax=Burkholderia oklahomensis TaxID=342113 RepID=UPI00264B85E8|nr:gas vesicle protein GvpN [Burkholderia oklahomensis]MDN7672537.1 gas vesicle protein GvpN [Burkholderia oklahomensis]